MLLLSVVLQLLAFLAFLAVSRDWRWPSRALVLAALALMFHRRVTALLLAGSDGSTTWLESLDRLWQPLAISGLLLIGFSLLAKRK